jgi:esterase/lipase superfamily enzyme
MALKGDRATLSRINRIVLLSPDIDPAMCRRQAEKVKVLPEHFVIFSLRDDPALRLSSRRIGHTNRLVNLTRVEEAAG